ncbi:Uu.00g122510.m01.CDS01 [Anthostomella pinea]|uniref:Uu.00g122510.m01.CDS01 n=1 Tax=Anthostomella pinea TaxID=933095 RepID=A0AAI8VH88_9PEZI|nr:Uu.00g122510.m01.CDS01 [Anthostomella pinea]
MGAQGDDLDGLTNDDVFQLNAVLFGKRQVDLTNFGLNVASQQQKQPQQQQPQQQQPQQQQPQQQQPQQQQPQQQQPQQQQPQQHQHQRFTHEDIAELDAVLFGHSPNNRQVVTNHGLSVASQQQQQPQQHQHQQQHQQAQLAHNQHQHQNIEVQDQQPEQQQPPLAVTVPPPPTSGTTPTTPDTMFATPDTRKNDSPNTINTTPDTTNTTRSITNATPDTPTPSNFNYLPEQAICGNCHRSYFLDNNGPNACHYHSGTPQVNASSPIWHAMRIETPEDTPYNRRRCPIGFRYSCCGRDMIAWLGCVSGRHEPPLAAPPAPMAPESAQGHDSEEDAPWDLEE